jgi:hypothetical protein
MWPCEIALQYAAADVWDYCTGRVAHCVAALRHVQMPFEVGEEVTFKPNGQVIEGIVIDVGWYR